MPVEGLWRPDLCSGHRCDRYQQGEAASNRRAVRCCRPRRSGSLLRIEIAANRNYGTGCSTTLACTASRGRMMVRGPRVRIQLPPAASRQRTCFSADHDRACDDPVPHPPHNVEIAGRIGGTARPGGLGFAPNGREPRLLMPRQSWRAVVMPHLLETGRGDVIAPSIQIGEASVAIVGKALLVIPSRI